MEEIKEYVNSDLANLTETQHNNLFDVPGPGNSEFIDNLEWALMFLNSDKRGSPIRYNEMEEHVFNINTFDGAWLLGLGKLGAREDNDIKFFAPLGEMQSTFDMFDSFNIKIFNLRQTKIKINKNEDDILTSLGKIRLMDSKETRHLKFSKYVIEDRMAAIAKNEKWYTWGEYAALFPHEEDVSGKKIKCFAPVPIAFKPGYFIDPKYLKEYVKTEQYIEKVRRYHMCLNIRLTAYYEWFVYIKEDEKSLGIKVPIEPESSKDIFALRDIPEGTKRKKAICNFVRQHYRNINVKSNGYNEEIRQTLIKQHLRGETKFNWRGLQINIIPAEYDLKRIKTSKKFVNI